MTAKKKAKKNQQDATLRNIRALKKRMEAVERRASVLEVYTGLAFEDVQHWAKQKAKK